MPLSHWIYWLESKSQGVYHPYSDPDMIFFLLVWDLEDFISSGCNYWVEQQGEKKDGATGKPKFPPAAKKQKHVKIDLK